MGIKDYIPGFWGKVVRREDSMGLSDIAAFAARKAGGHAVAAGVAGMLTVGGVMGVGPEAAPEGTITGDLQAAARNGATTIVVDRDFPRAADLLASTGVKIGKHIRETSPKELAKDFAHHTVDKAVEGGAIGAGSTLGVLGVTTAASAAFRKKGKGSSQEHGHETAHHRFTADEQCESRKLAPPVRTPGPPKAQPTHKKTTEIS